MCQKGRVPRHMSCNHSRTTLSHAKLAQSTLSHVCRHSSRCILSLSLSLLLALSLSFALVRSLARVEKGVQVNTHAATCSNVHGSLGAYRSFQRRRSRKSISAWRGPCCGHYTKILPRRFKIHPRTKYIFLSNFHFWRIQSAPKQETKCVHQKNVDL